MCPPDNIMIQFLHSATNRATVVYFESIFFSYLKHICCSGNSGHSKFEIHVVYIHLIRKRISDHTTNVFLSCVLYIIMLVQQCINSIPCNIGLIEFHLFSAKWQWVLKRKPRKRLGAHKNVRDAGKRFKTGICSKHWICIGTKIA